MKINDKSTLLPILFININILNILDKTITWFVLHNPRISELNPIASYFINEIGLTMAMILYTFIGFTLFYITYRIVIMKRLTCEKNNMPPEVIFIMLNIIFCFIVLNNIYWMLLD